MTIETGFDSNYRKVMVAARRIAQEEITAGKIAYEKIEAPVVKPLIEGPAVPILLS
jgi:hypothetical protein